MNLVDFNKLSKDEAIKHLNSCCTSRKWQERVAGERPFASLDGLLETQEDIWKSLDKDDFLEAFDGHPKIGNVNSLKQKYAHTKELASGEQSGVNSASDDVIQELADYNEKYEKRFGYIFIVCATGKSAGEMLEILKSRINNEPAVELRIAAGEQAKITKIRLEKLL